mmetsp:Transcript_20609/g.40269  ORF Transcript_20609/g.40269 Transcript_20609/m.40269 type:complete len:537 (+) Transcript_20609:163-1773(+)
MAMPWCPPEQSRGGVTGGSNISQLVRSYGVLPASPCVVKNTFLHVVGEDPSESFDAPPIPRRQMSEPPKLRRKEPDLLWHAEELPIDQDWRQTEDHDSLNDVDLRVMSGCVGDNYASTCAGSRQDSSGSDDRSGSERQGWPGLNEAWRYLLPSSTRDTKSCTSTLEVLPNILENEPGSVSAELPPSGCPDGGSMAATPPMQSLGPDPRQCSRTGPVSWDDAVVTVMVRQIPRHFTQLTFLMEVKARGFDELFDFLYLPFDHKKGINVRYGFLGFIEAKYAQDFRREFDGTFLDERMKAKWKPVRVQPANVQGYDANYQHFVQSQTRQRQDIQFSPLFRPGASSKPRGEWRHPGRTQANTVPVREQQQSQSSPYAAADATCCREEGSACPVPAAATSEQSALDAARQSSHAEHFHPGNSPIACHACGAPHGAKHNFCSTCGAQVANRVVFTPTPNLGGFRGVDEGTAKLFQDLETEHHRLAKELADARSEGHRRVTGQTVQQRQQQQQQQHQHSGSSCSFHSTLPGTSHYAQGAPLR